MSGVHASRRFGRLGLFALCAGLGMALAVPVWAWNAAADDDQYAKEMDALRKFQFLIGNWRASSQIQDGESSGIVENVTWAWHLVRDEPPALKISIPDGDFVTSALLR